MIAFDTNLLVRLAVNDDQHQADIAEQMINNNEVFYNGRKTFWSGKAKISHGAKLRFIEKLRHINTLRYYRSGRSFFQFQLHHIFNMIGVREHIHWLYFSYFIY